MTLEGARPKSVSFMSGSRFIDLMHVLHGIMVRPMALESLADRGASVEPKRAWRR